MLLIQEYTRFIKETALSLGFTHCGIAKASPLDDDARRLEKWLHAGMQGSMQYLENHFDLRVDPTKLVPGAKSVITLTQNYYSPKKQPADSPKISTYAYGTDYHFVIKEKLNKLLASLQQKARLYTMIHSQKIIVVVVQNVLTPAPQMLFYRTKPLQAINVSAILLSN